MSPNKGRARFTVSQAANEVEQPTGGFIDPLKSIWIPIEYKGFEIDDQETIMLTGTDYQKESLPPANIGTIVDYMTRFMLDLNNGCSRWSLTGSLSTLFYGSIRVEELGVEVPPGMELDTLYSKVSGLDDDSINAMCALMKYEYALRTGRVDFSEKNLYADQLTCEHIRIMVNRTLSAFDMLGIKNDVVPGAFFSRNAYGNIVTRGDGDYVSPSMLLDMKVSKKEGLTTIQTLQLAMYYILGKRSCNGCILSTTGISLQCNYSQMNKIGIINPRQGLIQIIDMRDIDPEILDKIARDVMGIPEGFLEHERLIQQGGHCGPISITNCD